MLPSCTFVSDLTSACIIHLKRNNVKVISGQTSGVLGPDQLSYDANIIKRLKQFIQNTKRSREAHKIRYFRAFDNNVFWVQWKTIEKYAFEISFHAIGRNDKFKKLELYSVKLGVKELIVARLIVDGKTVQEIAQMRGVSVYTVREQRRRIFRKLGINSDSDLPRLLRGLDPITIQKEPTQTVVVPKKVTKRYGKETILAALEDDYKGRPVDEILRTHGISKELLNIWRYKYKYLSKKKLKELNEAMRENVELKRQIQELTQKLNAILTDKVRD